MKLMRVFALSTISPVLGVLTGLVTTKIFAVLVGPAGLPLVSQLNNLGQALVGMASSGGGTFIVRKLASSGEQGDADRTHRVLANASFFILSISFVLSGALLGVHQWLGNQLFGTGAYDWVLVLLALCLPLSSLKAILTAGFNGKQEIATLTRVGVISQLVSFATSVVFALAWNLQGVLATVAIGQTIAFFVGLRPFLKKRWLRFPLRKSDWSGELQRSLLKFAAMAVTSAIMVPIVLIGIRGTAIAQLGLTQVGYWDAVTRVSSIYLSVLTSSLSVYLLPKLSSSTSLLVQRAESFKVLGLVLVAMAAISVLVLLSLDWIIPLVYTPEFFPMKDLFPYQLVGDTLKLVSWVFGYHLVTRGLTRAFITIEVVFGCLYYAMAQYFVSLWGVVGLPLAYIANNLLLLLVLLFLLRDLLRWKEKKGAAD